MSTEERPQQSGDAEQKKYREDRRRTINALAEKARAMGLESIHFDRSDMKKVVAAYVGNGPKNRATQISTEDGFYDAVSRKIKTAAAKAADARASKLPTAANDHVGHGAANDGEAIGTTRKVVSKTSPEQWPPLHAQAALNKLYTMAGMKAPYPGGKAANEEAPHLTPTTRELTPTERAGTDAAAEARRDDLIPPEDR